MSENPASDGGDIRRLLEQVRDGQLSTEQALERLRDLPYQDLGYARIDHHRPLRTGSPEVVLGKGKTPRQVAGIVAALRGRGYPVLVTKTGWDAYAAVIEIAPEAQFHDLAGAITIQSSSQFPLPLGEGQGGGVSAVYARMSKSRIHPHPITLP